MKPKNKCPNCGGKYYKTHSCELYRIAKRRLAKNFRLNNPEKYKLYQKISHERKIRKASCKIIYQTAQDLKDDKDSLIRDNEFVKKYIGFTCPKLEGNKQ